MTRQTAVVLFFLLIVTITKCNVVEKVSDCSADSLTFTVSSTVSDDVQISEKKGNCTWATGKGKNVTVEFAKCGIHPLTMEPHGYMAFAVLHANDSGTFYEFTVQCFYASSFTYKSEVGVGGSSDDWQGGGSHTGPTVESELAAEFHDAGGKTQDVVKMGDDVVFSIKTQSANYKAIMPEKCKFGDTANFDDGAEILFVNSGCPTQPIPGVTQQMSRVDSKHYKLEFKAFKLQNSSKLHIVCNVKLCLFEQECKLDCWNTTESGGGTGGETGTTTTTTTTAATTTTTTAVARKKREAIQTQTKQIQKELTILDDYIEQEMTLKDCVPRHMLHAAYVAMAILAGLFVICILMIAYMLIKGKRSSKYVENVYSSQYPIGTSMSSLGSQMRT